MVEEFRIGVISTTHGLKGEVKVFPTTDDPRRFALLTEVTLEQKGQRRTMKLRNVRFFKAQVILAFDGVDSVEDAAKLRGGELYISREKALPLAEGEHYVPDLLGLAVYEGEEQIGVLEDVLRTGANDVYEVRTPEGKRLLLPAIPSCILSVDTEAGRMTVHVLDGLRDL